MFSRGMRLALAWVKGRNESRKLAPPIVFYLILTAKCQTGMNAFLTCNPACKNRAAKTARRGAPRPIAALRGTDTSPSGAKFAPKWRPLQRRPGAGRSGTPTRRPGNRRTGRRSRQTHDQFFEHQPRSGGRRADPLKRQIGVQQPAIKLFRPLSAQLAQLDFGLSQQKRLHARLAQGLPQIDPTTRLFGLFDQPARRREPPQAGGHLSQ